MVSGERLNEIGVIDGIKRIEVDPLYFRLTELETLLGESKLAQCENSWKIKIYIRRSCKRNDQGRLKQSIRSIKPWVILNISSTIYYTNLKK